MNFENYNFLDFGCSTGGNIEFVEKNLLNVKGLGIDIDPKKVDAARGRGMEAVLYDILAIERRKMVEFVTMSHFLEHLSSPREAEKFIRKAVDVSRSFVHIRQPFFDGDGYLMGLGLKCYWSDWGGHPNNMKMLDFYKIGKKLLNIGAIKKFSIFGRSMIHDSLDDSIVLLNSPPNRGRWDMSLGEKSKKIFSLPLYKETVMEILVSNIDDSGNLEKLRSILISKGAMNLIFDSDSPLELV